MFGKMKKSAGKPMMMKKEMAEYGKKAVAKKAAPKKMGKKK